jgi:pyruvate dehydrogenase E2 component (dihydrolipoamide acetyltransferase)
VLIKVENGGAAVAAPAPAPRQPHRRRPFGCSGCRCSAGGGVVEVKVPDIGDFADVPVIELFVKVGDSIKVDDAIATLESDKATMDVPSTVAGTVKEVLVQLGSKVGEGTVLIKVETGASAPAAAPQAAARRLPLHPSRFLPRFRRPQQHRRRWLRPCRRQQGPRLAVRPRLCPRTRRRSEQSCRHRPEEPHRQGRPDQVRQGRDVRAISGPVAAAAGGVVGGGVLDLLPWPKVDFAKFGEIEVKPLSRIKKISGQNLSRNWVMIPADLSRRCRHHRHRSFRVLLNKENERVAAPS